MAILSEWTAPIFGIIPPWTSIPLALLGWVGIYFYWTMKVSVAGSLNEAGLLLGGVFAAITLSAGYRGFQFRRNQGQFVVNRVSLSLFKQLDEDDFGKLLAAFYHQEGYAVEELSDDASERGIALVLRKNGEKIIVQHFGPGKNGKVGIEKVRELYGIQAHEGANKSVLIARGLFTKPALNFAAGKPMELIDGGQFAELARRLDLREERASDNTRLSWASLRCLF